MSVSNCPANFITSENGVTVNDVLTYFIMMQLVQEIVTMKSPKGKGAAKYSKESLKPVDDRLVLLFCLNSSFFGKK